MLTSRQWTEARITCNCIRIFLPVRGVVWSFIACLTVSEWASGDRNAVAEWDYGVTDGGIAYHKVHRQTQLLFSEVSSKAEWGDWYWATESHEKMTHQSGSDVNVRGKFSSDGKLDNSKDTNYRPISQDWPVFAFAVDLEIVDSTPASTLFTIGLYQTDAIQYNAPSGERSVPSLWTDYFSDERAAVRVLSAGSRRC
jgi:hypothetical protein